MNVEEQDMGQYITAADISQGSPVLMVVSRSETIQPVPARVQATVCP